MEEPDINSFVQITCVGAEIIVDEYSAPRFDLPVGRIKLRITYSCLCRDHRSDRIIFRPSGSVWFGNTVVFIKKLYTRCFGFFYYNGRVQQRWRNVGTRRVAIAILDTIYL